MDTQILQVIPNQNNSCDLIEVKNITTDDIFLIKNKTGKIVYIITCRTSPTQGKEWMFLDIFSGSCGKCIKQDAGEIFKMWSERHDVQIIKNS